MTAMHCHTCGAENRSGRRFCNQCGAPLFESLEARPWLERARALVAAVAA